MYETMVYWETASTGDDQPAVVRDYARIWQAADKVVYSSTLDAVSSAAPRQSIMTGCQGSSDANPSSIMWDQARPAARPQSVVRLHLMRDTRQHRVSAASRGVEIVLVALVDGVGTVASAIGSDVAQAERDDDDGDDPQDVSGEANEPEDQCAGQDDQHHSTKARLLAEQKRDASSQPLPFGRLPGSAR